MTTHLHTEERMDALYQLVAAATPYYMKTASYDPNTETETLHRYMTNFSMHCPDTDTPESTKKFLTWLSGKIGEFQYRPEEHAALHQTIEKAKDTLNRHCSQRLQPDIIYLYSNYMDRTVACYEQAVKDVLSDQTAILNNSSITASEQKALLAVNDKAMMGLHQDLHKSWDTSIKIGIAGEATRDSLYHLSLQTQSSQPTTNI